MGRWHVWGLSFILAGTDGEFSPVCLLTDRSNHVQRGLHPLLFVPRDGAVRPSASAVLCPVLPASAPCLTRAFSLLLDEVQRELRSCSEGADKD